jgi:hypothetical protein
MKENVFKGSVSGKETRESGHERLRVEVTTNPGALGSPIFNERGKLVGVLVERLEGLSNLVLAVPRSGLERALERVEES